MTGPSETTVEELAERIGDGCLLALPKPEAGASMAAIRALIRRGARDLRLWCLPAAGLQADLLIGAGCVASIECSGVSLGEFGAAPRFRRAAENGTVRIVDSTCQAMYAAIQAGEKGMPFVALRGIVGSDVLAHREDWRTMQNPFEPEEDPVVVIPAVRPDMTLIHARLRDSFGNLWVGSAREAIVLAHAARRLGRDLRGALRRQPARRRAHDGGNHRPDLCRGHGARASGCAWPLALPGAYPADRERIAEYAASAGSEDGFAAWLDRHVFGTDRAA